MENEKSKTESKPAKLVTDGRVMCTYCKEFSGWTNDELIYVKPGKQLKCSNCKRVTVIVMDKNDMQMIHEDREDAMFIEQNIFTS